MTKYLKMGIFSVLAIFAAGCTEGDKFDPDMEIVLFSGTDDSPVVKIDSDEYALTVSATGKVSEDVTVGIKYDTSALDRYNDANKTSFQAVPESYVTLSANTATIEKGQFVSDEITMTITGDDFVEEGYIYVVPVSITNVEGGDLKFIESTKSILLRKTNEYNFTAFDVSSADLSSNYIFPDDKAIELSVYTYEIKLYPYSLKSKAGDICRVCAWEGKAEENATMLRFNESGYEWKSLQAVTPAGNIVSSGDTFDVNQWYVVSMVYDGSTMTMYVNGEAEDAKGTGDGTTTFQRFELGMSWGGYTSSQLFSGRIAEVRVWDRALSVTEIKEGICNVHPSSEGLRAYWKFNDGEGAVFHDATGNGYDMDWSDTSRDVSENGVMVQMDKSDIASGRWVTDEINNCRN